MSASPTQRPRHRTAAIGAPLIGLGLLTACGGATVSPCDPVETTIEDANSHVLMGNEIDYTFHPPSSGLHTPPGLEGGVVDEPIPEPIQVSTLEVGRVILQYDETVGADAVAELTDLAGDEVVVAPASEIDDDRPIAFTAWGRRQRCDDVSVPDARAFLRDHIGRGPGGHDS